MPSFSQNLEETLHRALAYANQRHHEYATLEHLLLALLDDRDAAAVMRACNVDLDCAAQALTDYLDNELAASIVKGSTEAKPTAGFQRVIQRAVIHVQSSGREEVTGANVLVAIFSERESHAAYFLQEQDMTRYDAVNYIAHGIAKRPGMSEPKPVRGADEDESGEGREGTARSSGRRRSRPTASTSTRRPRGQIDPLIGREPEVSAASRSSAGAEEQPAARGRPRRRQDRHRRGPGAQDHQRRGAGGAGRRRPSSRSTWARCWPAPATAATSRSG